MSGFKESTAVERPGRDRSRFAKLAVIVAMVALGMALARPGTTHSARPLSDVDPGAPGFPVQLSGDLPAEDGWRFATGRIKTGSDVLAAAGEIRFFVGTYGARPDAREFILRDTASGEVLFARDPGPVENNAEVRLRRVKDPVKSPAQPFRELRLEVSFRGGESLAVWAQVPGAGDESARRNLLVSSEDQRGIIWGTWMSDVQVAPASRFVMLDAMWDHAVVARLTLVLGLFLMACVFFGRHQVVLLFVGIAAIYAWLVPPFQAPDEPDHFLTLAEDIGGAAGDSMSTGALRLANLGHFESIKFRPAVKFAAEDVNHPDSGGWATHITPTGSHALRSPLAGILWPIAGSAVARLGAADALMTLRWFNVMLLAGAWLVFMGFVPVAFSFVSAMCLLTIPTLPFFGLHWSNHALPLASTVAATGVALRVISGTRARNADYLIWGGLSGLCFVSGVTGIASFAVMAGLAGISLLRDAKNSVAQDLRRGMSFAAGSLAVILSIGSREYLVEFIQRLMRWRTGPFAKIAEVNPYPVIVSVAILGICSLLVAGALRRRISVRFSGTFQFSRVTAWRTLVRFQAGSWILFVFAGLFYSGPFLPGIEGGEIPDVPLIRYAKIAVGAFLFGFGLGPGDPLVVKAFWGGFGWLDAYPPDWLLHLARFVPTAGISIILVRAVTRGEKRGQILALWLNVVTALVCLAVAALAFSSHRINVNLHGRYLAGVYVIYTAVASLGLAEVFSGRSQRIKNASRQAMIVAVVLIHSVCWYSLLIRYLGSPS